jgi:hypothetical protein
MVADLPLGVEPDRRFSAENRQALPRRGLRPEWALPAETADGPTLAAMGYIVVGFVLVAAILVAITYRYSMALVGQVAEEFGEDPRRWQMLMLPCGIFGPIVARVLLNRGGRGPGGFA